MRQTVPLADAKAAGSEVEGNRKTREETFLPQETKPNVLQCFARTCIEVKGYRNFL